MTARKLLVAGNWKMHGSHQMVKDLLTGVRRFYEAECSVQVEVAVFPPALYLEQVRRELAESGIAYGAQNVSEYEQGAYTGEIAADMLADLNCRYVLVGHSERRTLFGETNGQIADKFAAAQRKGLIPVLCIGETLQQREQGLTLNVIAAQLDAVIERVGLEMLANAVIAYEPVWAIGTGATATPQQAQEVHLAIRQKLRDQGAQTRIVYSGSVKSANAAELFSQPDIDGGLIGGASLDAEEFCGIYRAAKAVKQ